MSFFTTTRHKLEILAPNKRQNSLIVMRIRLCDHIRLRIISLQNRIKRAGKHLVQLGYKLSLGDPPIMELSFQNFNFFLMVSFDLDIFVKVAVKPWPLLLGGLFFFELELL
jgi:hypothetical protein